MRDLVWSGINFKPKNGITTQHSKSVMPSKPEAVSLFFFTVRIVSHTYYMEHLEAILNNINYN